MSNQIFNFNSTPVRVELFDNQPHFCLLDVCEIFEIQNSRRVQSQMLDPQGVRQAYILARDEKQRKTSFINEPNLYRIIFRSEKPIAKDFQNWVFEEVLPQIRKTGQYSQNAQPNLPLIEEKTHTLTLTDRELHRLCWLWKMAEIMRQLIGFVQKPLELLGSRYAASAWGYSNEYKFSLEKTRQILVRETAHVQPDPLDRHGWNNVIHELRSGKIR